jgi:signal transduction histidine kinase
MAELKATVGVLRRDEAEAPRAPAPGLAQLDGLLEMATGAGVRVELSVAGARALPGAVDLTAYRIVQESLTNVVRHGEGIRRDAVHPLRARRDCPRGRGRRARPNGARAGHDGHGLIGMRERAAAVGGTLQAGAAPGGGFRVHARLPTPRASA